MSAHRNYGIPRRVDPAPLSWLTRADPITKLALFLAAFASIFCVGGAVMMAVARATF